MKAVDLTGQRFGRLRVDALVVQFPPPKRRRWSTTCDCGKTLEVLGESLVSGNTTSCGCVRREVSSARSLRHGMSDTPEFRIWQGIIKRCTNPKAEKFEIYGGRGIRICDRWRDSFEAFLADMGPRPSPSHSVDRFPDQDGNYELTNCRWATPIEQANNMRTNRRVNFEGKDQTIAEWARERGLPYQTLIHRFDAGWTAEEALS